MYTIHHKECAQTCFTSVIQNKASTTETYGIGTIAIQDSRTLEQLLNETSKWCLKVTSTGYAYNYMGKLSKPLLVWGKINMKCYGAAVFNAYLLVMVNAR